jgi:hypothetical protein
MLDFSGTATGFAGHTHFTGLRDISLKGGAADNTLLRLYYVDNFRARNILFHDSTGKMIDAVECWDTSFTQCQWVTGGGAGGSTKPMIHIRNSAATSGFGFGTDNSNMIWFNQCRWEDFKAGAVWIERGLGGTSNPNGFFFSQCKFETHTVGGKVVYFDDYTMHVSMSQIEFFVGAFAAGYSTPVSVILCIASVSAYFRDIRLVTQEQQTVDKGIEAWCSNGPLVIDGFQHTSSGNAAHNPITGLVSLELATGRAEVANVFSSDNAPAIVGFHPASRTLAYAATLSPGNQTAVRMTLRVTLTGNVTTLNVPAKGQVGDRVQWIFTQDGTGGRTVTFAGGYKVNWSPTTTANKINVIELEYDGVNWVQIATAVNL